MLLRTALIAATALTLAACSSTKEDAMVDQQVAPVSGESYQQDGMMNDATNMQGYDTAALNGNVEGGTQADLVANVGDRVLFSTDSYTLDGSARGILEQQANWLMRYPNLTITVEGHADERGTREYNLALGDRRANAVENYLVAFGVDPRRINTISYGKERPAVPGNYASAWAQNRRSVTKVD
jgi:peptidoglycan-associated lipoprotein